MKNMLTKKQAIKAGRKKIAEMVESFINRSCYQNEETVKKIYREYSNVWDDYVRKINARNNSFILSFDVWDREWKRDGYKKVLAIPVPKQLSELERNKLIAMKTELMRLVYIVEGKTQHQRERRDFFYKTIFIIIRIKLFIKNLFKKKETLTQTPTQTPTQTMRVV